MTSSDISKCLQWLQFLRIFEDLGVVFSLFEGIRPTHKQIDPIYKLYYLYAEAFYWLTPKGHTISLCPLWLTDSIFDTKTRQIKFQKFQNPFYLPIFLTRRRCFSHVNTKQWHHNKLEQSAGSLIQEDRKNYSNCTT